jgi:DNA-binding beta-propeller fold protein YncE
VSARAGAFLLPLAVVGLLSACSPDGTGGTASPAGTATASSVPMISGSPSPPSTPSTPGAALNASVAGFLLPGEAGSLPAVPAGVPFSGHLLIAENSGHSRLLEIDGTGTVTWRFSTASPPRPHPLGPPDDAFYAPDGGSILVSSEDGQGGMAIDRVSGSTLWQVGTFDHRGNDATHFNNPDDLAPAADGTAWLADINNCRILHLDGDTGAVAAALGGHGCKHNPPQQLAMPNGAFPTRDGSLVVTEIGGSWVDWVNPDGTLRWSHHVAASYPSDALAYPDGSVLFTDYSSPGAVLRIGADGAVIWRYAPRGKEQLNHTSIAVPLAVNRVAICDDLNNRIVVVDPTTSTVVWQWRGSGADALLHPDGIDYRPS